MADLVNVPPEEEARQAIDSLRGYAYQIYQSLLAWLRLKSDEVLFLEVAEDYATVLDGDINATQVKHSSDAITLRSPSVHQAMHSLLRFQAENKQKTVSVSFLSTQNSGKEKKTEFPGGVSGIEYWRKATREKTDVGPLRDFFLSLNIQGPLREFFESSSDSEIKERMLRRISWDLGAPNLEASINAIDQMLIDLGEKQGLTPGESVAARTRLGGFILERITTSNDRRLTRADLLRCFESIAMVQVPAAQIRRSLGGLAGFGIDQSDTTSSMVAPDLLTNPDQLKLSPYIANRADLVSSLDRSLNDDGILWLHGSSGLGKTTLAKQIALGSEQKWAILSFRDCLNDFVQANTRLRAAQLVSYQGHVGGLILDDLPSNGLRELETQLTLLFNFAASNGICIIVTSNLASPNRLSDQIDNAQIVNTAVPYLQISDVGEIVKSQGGDPSKWAQPIHTFCSQGHPLLVSARVKGLARRDWQASALDELFQEPKEVIEEKEFIRRQIVHELSEAERALIYRCSVFLGGAFDKRLLFALADVQPTLGMPGELLDSLKGPWIETSGAKLTLSPIISDSGKYILSEEENQTLVTAAIDELINRNPFPAEFLNFFFIQSLSCKHIEGLNWLALAVTTASDENLRLISENLSIMTGLVADKPLIESDPGTEALLRLAQLLVCLTLSENKNTEEIIRLCHSAADLVPEPSAGIAIKIASLAKALMHDEPGLSVGQWLQMIEELGFLAEEAAAAGSITDPATFFDPELGERSAEQFLFVFRSAKLGTVEELLSLLKHLDVMRVERRTFLMKVFDLPEISLKTMVNSAWLSEHRAGSIDGTSANESYEAACRIALGWKDINLAAECLVVQAVMLDEYTNDPEAALRLIAEAPTELAGHPVLQRQHGKILYRNDKYQEALEILEACAENLKGDAPTERVFAFREAGICAAEINDFQRASSLFLRAYDEASQISGLEALTAGLLADKAYIELKGGDSEAFINDLASALEIREGFIGNEGLQEKFCTLILGHLMLVVLGEIVPDRWHDPNMTIRYGGCSNTDPSEELMNRPVPAIELTWAILAQLELILDTPTDVWRNRVGIGEQRPLKAFDASLMRERVAHGIRKQDTDIFGKAVVPFVSVAKAARTDLADGPDGGVSSEVVELIKPSELLTEQNRLVTLDAIASFLWFDGLRKRYADQAILHAKIQDMVELSSYLDGIFESRNSEQVNAHNIEEAIPMLCRMISENWQPYPEDLFLIQARTLFWLGDSLFKDVTTKPVAIEFRDQWRRVLGTQRFHLMSAGVNAKLITRSVTSKREGLALMADTLLQAENAVRHHFSEETRAAIASYL